MNVTRGLVIHWKGSIREHILLPDLARAKPMIVSLERWEVGGKYKWISYNARAMLSSTKEGQVLTLTYKRADQNSYVAANGFFGKSTVRLPSGGGAPSATWSDDTNSYANGTARKVIVHDGTFPRRTKAKVSVTLRPDQQELRKALLDLDGHCIITRERLPDVLDAAHLIPVSEDGQECIDNAILLRADLHRLLDARLFWFLPLLLLLHQLRPMPSASCYQRT